MTEGMLQLQLLVPSLKTDAAITATMNKADGLTMELKSDVKLLDASSIQAVTFKYGMSVQANGKNGLGNRCFKAFLQKYFKYNKF